MNIESKKKHSNKVKFTKRTGEVYDALTELSRLKHSPSFGELIRSIRICDKISQTELANKLGISKQHLSAIEKGHKSVSISRAAKFAEALGYPLDQFVLAAIEDELRQAGVDLNVNLKQIING